MLLHVNANVYDCQRGEAKGCSEVNRVLGLFLMLLQMCAS